MESSPRAHVWETRCFTTARIQLFALQTCWWTCLLPFCHICHKIILHFEIAHFFQHQNVCQCKKVMCKTRPTKTQSKTEIETVTLEKRSVLNCGLTVELQHLNWIHYPNYIGCTAAVIQPTGYITTKMKTKNKQVLYLFFIQSRTSTYNVTQQPKTLRTFFFKQPHQRGYSDIQFENVKKASNQGRKWLSCLRSLIHACSFMSLCSTLSW